jgi:hypothetical protein
MNYFDDSESEKDDTEIEHNINRIDFTVTSDFNDIEFDEDEKALLSQPSGLTKVFLIYDYYKNKTKEIDFTGTTCEQAIKKILQFYKNKTNRRGIGDHVFFEGIWIFNGKLTIALGS